jgi:PleD family two-component response regulator
MNDFLKLLGQKIESVFGKTNSSSRELEESYSRETHGQSSNSELEIWVSSIEDQSIEAIKDFLESKKYDSLTRKYDSSRETLKRFIQLSEEVEKELEQINPSLKTKITNKVSSVSGKIKNILKRNSKLLKEKSESTK